MNLFGLVCAAPSCQPALITPPYLIAYCQFSLSHHHQNHSQIKSRIKEVKEDECSNSLAKIEVCAMFRAIDIRRNVLLKLIRLCMETPCLCPSDGHKYGGR